MKKKRVALLYGGRGKEHEVSKMSASFVLGIIDKERYIVHPILIDKDGGWYYREDRERPVSVSFSAPHFRLGERVLHVDVVLPMLHGDGGEDGTIAGALECIGVPYVGCLVGAGALSADKAYTKAVARQIGIPTAKDILVCRGEDISAAIRQAEESIGYPMFVKPTDLGSSVGASAVYSPSDIEPALSSALALSRRVLIEELVEEKRELECAYLMTRGGEYISDPAEVICHGTYDYRKKYEGGGVATVVRADVPERVRQKAREYTRALARQIGIRQLSRVDYFLTPSGLLLNEVNTMPGFTATSLYAEMVREMGIDPTALISELIEGAQVL